MKNEFKLIGKGAFTKAYLNNKDGLVYLSSDDPIKEVMGLGWFPTGRLFPCILPVYNEEILNLRIFLGKACYKMDYYPAVISLKKVLSEHDYKLYTILKNYNGYKQDYYSIFKFFKTLPDLYASEREELIDALDACTNTGAELGFECSPRNVRVLGRKLILLDCFFNTKELQKTIKSKIVRY